MKKFKVNYMFILIMLLILTLGGCTDTSTTNENEGSEGETLQLLEKDEVSESTESSEENSDNETETADDTDTETDGDESETETETETQEVEVNTEATELNGYYADAYSLNGKQLKDTLNDIITEGHGTLSYSQVYTALEETDEDPNDPSKVVLFYKGISVPDNELRESGDGDIWNREHIWAKSHGDFGTVRGPGTDLHMIRPTDASVNTRRGHLDFDESDDVFSEAPDTYADDDSFEPRDEVKGDVARMIFYMAVRYEGEDGEVDLEVSNRTDTYFLTDDGYGEHGKLDTLLQWHIDDPVDDFEIRRNDVIHDMQGNRNPFIDHPEYIGRIWGESYAIDNSGSETNNEAVVDETQDDEYIDTIDVIRSESDGYTLTTSGIVTYIETETTLYMQDETGGIRVDSYGSNVNMYSYKPGQSLIVTGEVDTYKGEKEIKISSSNDVITLNDSKNLSGTEAYLADINAYDHQGELVLIKDVQVIDINSNTIVIEDKYGETMSVYTGNTVDYYSNNIEMYTDYDIVGIAAWYNGVQIKLMSGQDISE